MSRLVRRHLSKRKLTSLRSHPSSGTRWVLKSHFLSISSLLTLSFSSRFLLIDYRTQTYPHAFLVPPFEVSGSFNYSTYVLFDGIIWKATAGQINRWRAKDMNLGPTDQSHLEAMKVPFVYNFSSSVVPHPIDWKDNIMISGYWFLDDSGEPLLSLSGLVRGEELETDLPFLHSSSLRSRLDSSRLVEGVHSEG